MKKASVVLLLLLVFCCTLSAQSDTVSQYDTILVNNDGLTYGYLRNFIADKKNKYEDKMTLMLTAKVMSSIPSMHYNENILLKMLPEAKERKDKRAIMAFYCDISMMYIMQAKLDRASVYLDSASVYKPYVEDLRTLAKYNFYKGHYIAFMCSPYDVEAYQYYYRAIYYYEQLGGYDTQIVSMLYNMAVGYLALEDKQSLNEAILKIESLNRDANTDFALNILYAASYYIEFSDTSNQNYLDSMINCSRKALLINEQNNISIKDNSSKPMLYLNIAIAESQRSENVDYTLISDMINKAEPYKTIAPIILARINILKADMFIKQRKYDKALNVVLEALEYYQISSDMNEKLNANIYQRELYALFVRIYEAKKDYKKAFEYEVKKNELYTEANKTNKYSIIKNLEYRYESDKKEQQISHLTERQAYQQKIQILYVGIIALLVILVIVLVLWLRNRQKKSQQRITGLRQRIVRSKYIPHFTGNVLNSINYLIEKDKRLAQEYISEFASFNRRSMQNAEKLSLPLSDELQFTEQYLKLEKLRYEDKLEYTVSVDPSIDTSTFTVPVMVLHTFCENAIKHGFRHKEGIGHLKIEVYREAVGIVMAVEDDGIGRTAAREMNTAGTGEGLSIINQQIDFFNKNNEKEACLRITDLYTEQGMARGTRFEFYMPDGFTINV